MEGQKPRLRWRRTWPCWTWPANVDKDYTASIDEPRGYCRVWLVVGGPQGGRWAWSAATWYDAGTGFEDSAREAALAAEDALFRRIELERAF